MSDELKVLKYVVLKLQELNIAYMITGSVAANYYTVPRMTRDIDIVIELNLNDVDKALNAFSDSFYIDKEMIEEAIKHQTSFNLIHNEMLVKIDFLIKKDTEYRQLEFSRRNIVKLADIMLSITTPEDLIISKLNWAKDSYSRAQIDDVKNIINDCANLDLDYLNKWIEKLNLKQIYQEVTK